MEPAVLLWVEVLAGPVVWFISLSASFALAPWGCAYGWQPALYAIPGVALLITALCGFAAWREWARIGRDFPGELGGAVARTRTLSSAGVLLNGFFVIVLLAQIIVPVVLGACELG